MIAFRPVPLKLRMGQGPTIPPLPKGPDASGQPMVPGAIPRDNWDLKGILITAAVVGITGVAAYSGINGGLSESNKTQKTMDLFYGVGSAVLGLVFLASRLHLLGLRGSQTTTA